MSSNQQWFWLCKKRQTEQANAKPKWGLVQHDRTMTMYRKIIKK